MTQIHIRIGQLMEKHGFTNQSLADASDVPIGTISGIRSGNVRNPGYSAICAMLTAMGEPVSALSGSAENASTESVADSTDGVHLPDNGFTEQQQTIMEKSCQIATLSAKLDARDESAERNADRYAKLEAQLQAERRRNIRLQYAFIIVCVLIVVLAAMYIWDVNNLHSGLTAYFNQ